MGPRGPRSFACGALVFSSREPASADPSPAARPQVPEQGARLCLYADGEQLSPQNFGRVAEHTELLLLTKGQTWQGCELGSGGPVLAPLSLCPLLFT